MGIHRECDQNPEESEISVNLRGEFGLTARDIYDFWAAYIEALAHYKNTKRAIWEIRKKFHADGKGEQCVAYLAAISLDALVMDYCKRGGTAIVDKVM